MKRKRAAMSTDELHAIECVRRIYTAVTSLDEPGAELAAIADPERRENAINSLIIATNLLLGVLDACGALNPRPNSKRPKLQLVK